MEGQRLDEKRLRLLLEVGTSLVAELDREAVLRRVLEAGRELTGARYAAVGILDPERRELESSLVVDSTAAYVLFDQHIPARWVWRKLSGKDFTREPV